MPKADSKKPRGRSRKRSSQPPPKSNADDSSKAEKAAAMTSSPRRRTPRRSVSKPKYKDSDSDEAYVDDDEEEEVEEKKPKGTTKRTSAKRKTTSTRATTASAKKKKRGSKNNNDDEDYEEEGSNNDDDDDLNYDQEDDDKSTTSSKPSSKRRRSSSTRPQVTSKEKFLQLKPGKKYVTKYGVVEIISDDQLPPDHHKSKVTNAEIKAAKSMYKQMDRYTAKKDKLMDELAVGSRHRREELKKIYLESIGANNNNNRSSSSNGISMQKKVWQQYCTTIKAPEHILQDGKSWENANNNNGSDGKVEFESLNENDPRIPADYYPDRIVKCKLVNDERDSFDVKGPKVGTSHLQYIQRDPVDTTVVVQPPTITLYLARRELTRVYDPQEPNYICSFCGERNFKWRPHVKYHIDQGYCTEGKALVREDNEKRIQAIENKALSSASSSSTTTTITKEFLSKMHAVVAAKVNTVSYKKVEEFGNPCKIKPSQRDKMPPWIVFNANRSSLYPEMYITLGFRRGSQNRNFYNKKKLEEDYIPRGERRIERKKRKRMSLPGGAKNIRPSTHASRFSSVKISKVSGIAQNVSLPPLPSIPNVDGADNSTMPPLPPVGDVDGMDVDFGSNYNNGDDSDDNMVGTDVSLDKNPSSTSSANKKHTIFTTKEREYTVPFPELGEGWTKRTRKRPNSAVNDIHYFSPDGWVFRSLVDARKFIGGYENKGKRARGSRQPSVQTQFIKSIGKTNDAPVVIDTQVLAAECEAGRYPTINPFHGDHRDECILCSKPEEDEEAPLLECDFCKNSVHQVCLNKAMLRKDPPVNLREAEPHDSQMCHECLTVCLAQRARAETRRVMKWQHELAKAGLQDIPEAAGLPEEVNLKGTTDGYDDSEDQKQEDPPTYKPCPTGGPGGLICCSYCNASYSRVLSNTAKEMEAQSIARNGQEVSEILELLADAKKRLSVATDISRANDERRSLFKNNEGAFSGGA